MRGHTNRWPFEGTWKSGFRVMIFFRSYVSTNQFPDKKRVFDSPLPESWILSPEAMNPDLESIINQTKHCMPFSFSHEHFLQSWTIKRKDRSLGWDQFSRNQLFDQLCRPLRIINQLATAHWIEQVKANLQKVADHDKPFYYWICHWVKIIIAMIP